ncbi:hypothetical protein D3C85_1776730 [compost metagenome]
MADSDSHVLEKRTPSLPVKLFTPGRSTELTASLLPEYLMCWYINCACGSTRRLLASSPKANDLPTSADANPPQPDVFNSRSAVAAFVFTL